MNVLAAPSRPTAAQSLLSFAPNTRSAPTSAPSLALDTFTRGSTGEKVKQVAVIGGVALVGAALGAYAGLNTGFLAGLAGTVAGAAGGASLATAMKGQPIVGGACVGALAGMYVGSSVAGPLAAVAMGIAGATLPYGLIVAVFKGAE